MEQHAPKFRALLDNMSVTKRCRLLRSQGTEMACWAEYDTHTAFACLYSKKMVLLTANSQDQLDYIPIAHIVDNIDLHNMIENYETAELSDALILGYVGRNHYVTIIHN